MPTPVSETSSTTYGPGPSSERSSSGSCARSAFSVRMSSVPPSGIASRALTSRLRTTCCELAAVDEHRLERASEAGLQLDVLVQHAVEQLERLVDDVVQVDRLGLEHLLPAEREQLLRQLARPRRREVDLAHALGRPVLALDLAREEGARGADDGEDVVEVVRDAAGEAADRLHLLGVAQLLLEPLALGKGVPRGRDVAEVGGEERLLRHVEPRDRDLDRELAPVGAHGSQLDPQAEDRAAAGLEVTCEGLAMLVAERRRDDQVDHELPQRLVAEVAERLLGGRVEVDDATLVVDGDHAVEGGVEDRDLARVRLLELELGLAMAAPLLAVGEHAVDHEPEPREVRLEHDVARAGAQRLDRRLLADRSGEDHERDVGGDRVHDRLRLVRGEAGQVVVAERDVPVPAPRARRAAPAPSRLAAPTRRTRGDAARARRARRRPPSPRSAAG